MKKLFYIPVFFISLFCSINAQTDSTPAFLTPQGEMNSPFAPDSLRKNWDGNGNKIFKNIISGIFLNYRLISGQYYIHDKSRKIKRIECYHNGLLIGDCPQQQINSQKETDTLSGHHKVYNDFNQILKTGFFKMGKLVNGKEYFYGQKVHYNTIPSGKPSNPAKGILMGITVYKLGKRTSGFSGDFKNGKIYDGQKFLYDTNEILVQVKEYKNGMESGDFSGALKTYTVNHLRLSVEGEFKNGKIFTGKVYIYNSEGILQKIKIYKNGKYAGNDPLGN